MNLREFIKDALVDISAGISEAQENETFGGQIAPSKTGGHEYAQEKGVSTKGQIVSTVIEFDVAVTVQKAAKAAGSGKAQIVIFKGDASVEAGLNTESVSRLKFSVPFVFRPNDKQWHA